MRNSKTITVAAMLMAVVMTVMSLQAAVPVYGANTTSRNNITKATPTEGQPYPQVEFAYTQYVTCGSIRYISQSTTSENYHAEYWTKADGTVWGAGGECLTSCISMALSYVGSNTTPREILDYADGKTVWKNNWGGITSYAEDSFDTAFTNYVNGAGKYSPPIIHFASDDTFYPRGHYVLVIGKKSDNQYQVLDPSDGGNAAIRDVTIQDGMVSCSLWDKEFTASLSNAYQYYNANAVITNQPIEDTPSALASISGITYPETIVEGEPFTLKGNITSNTNITEVTATVTYMAGGEILKASVEPNALTYSLLKDIDQKIVFGQLAAGRYIYKVTATNAAGTATLIYAEFTVLPIAPTVTGVTNAAKGIKISWEEHESAFGYAIYRRTGDGELELISQVDDPGTTSFVDKGASSKYQKYGYTVSAYVTDMGLDLFSSQSDEISIHRIPTVSKFKIKRISSQKMKVSFAKQKKGTTYLIEYSTSKNFKNSKELTVSKNSCIISGLKRGKKYYVRVSAYYEIDEVTYAGAWKTSSKKY